MPWNPADSKTKTRGADTPKKQKVWATVANQVLAKTSDDGRAIREANAVINRLGGRYRRAS